MRFNYTSYDDLPTRAQHVIQKLGGMDKALEYYKVNESFIKIKNTGNKTNLELISLFEHLIFEKNILNPQEFTKEKEPSVPRNIQELVDYYSIRKLSATKRLANYLDKIEDEANFSAGLKNQTKFILYHFICDFNYFNARNLGAKTVEEIELIREEIRKRANLENSITLDNLEIEEDISKVIYRKISFSIPIDKIEKAITNNGKSYNLPLMLKIFLTHQRFNSKIIKGFDYYYFSDKKPDVETATKIFNCTKERVRQLKVSFKEKILPNSINQLLNTLGSIPYVLTNQNESIIELFEFENIESELYYNTSFLKFIYNYLNDYLDLNELIVDSKSFIPSQNPILISSVFADKVSLIELFGFLDNEIYNFEIVEFEYDREILIQRFYDENDLIIEPYELNKIKILIDKIIRINWTNIEPTIRRSKKRKEKDIIYDLVHSFILEKNESQKTKSILDYLIQNYVDISKEFLLNILNKNKARFQRVGNGYWTITELDKNVHGSLREIIEQKLFESEVPMHISEIHEYVNTLRPISEHSLRSNMRMEEDKIFTFFKCSFIGLSSKNYESYWFNLPKTIASNIRSIYNTTIQFNSEDEKIEYYSNLYQYPIIHLRYLLKNRKL
jgi:hypothetical protein